MNFSLTLTRPPTLTLSFSISLPHSSSQVVSFDDLIEINKRFPTLLAPVFMMQAKMMVRFQGELWWKNKVSGEGMRG